MSRSRTLWLIDWTGNLPITSYPPSWAVPPHITASVVWFLQELRAMTLCPWKLFYSSKCNFLKCVLRCDFIPSGFNGEAICSIWTWINVTFVIKCSVCIFPVLWLEEEASECGELLRRGQKLKSGFEQWGRREGREEGERESRRRDENE